MKDKKYITHGRDENQKVEFQYVNITNPVILGVKIAIGMFIVFPLFMIVLILLFFFVTSIIT